MEEMKLYLSSIVCVTCLSSDRDLNHVRSYEAELLPMLQFDMDEDKICWECRAMLYKFLKFQQRATNAQQIMQDVLVGKKNVIQTISTLKWQVKVDGKRKDYIEDESSTIVIKDVQNSESNDEQKNDPDIFNETPKIEVKDEFNYTYDDSNDDDINDEFLKEIDENKGGVKNNDTNDKDDDTVNDFPSNFDIDDDTTFKLIDTMLETYLESSVKKNRTVWYNCNRCEEKFTNESQLTHHKKTYHKSIPKCKYCGKVFSKTYNLKVHEQIHNKTSQPTYSCNICGETYYDTMSVHLHLKNAHGYKTDKSLHCKKCDKYFKTNISYVTHMKIHSK